MRALYKRALASQVPKRRLPNLVFELLRQLQKTNTSYVCEDALELLLDASDI